MKAAFDVSKTWVGLFLAVVLAAQSAWAAQSKGSLELQHRTTVGGKQLASGKYTVRWEGTGDQVEVQIYNGNKLVATTPGRVVKVATRPPSDTALVSINPDGSVSLSEIRFGGKDYILHLSDATEAGAGAAGSSK